MLRFLLATARKQGDHGRASPVRLTSFYIVQLNLYRLKYYRPKRTPVKREIGSFCHEWHE